MIEALKDFYEKNKLGDEAFHHAVSFLRDLKFLTDDDGNIADIDIKTLDHLIACLVTEKKNTVEHIVILMRYFKIAKRHDLFIHLTQYTGSLGVFESIVEKVKRVAGEKMYVRIKDLIKIPVLGTPLKEMPTYTQDLMDALNQHLSPNALKKVLADNHHQIPKEAFLEEKLYYEAADTLDMYLNDLHQRKVEELKRFQAEGRIWYEQEINDQVVAFVQSNPEILSAVRVDDDLYITKIPYDTKAYLEAATFKEKLYHACHCPFVKQIVADDIHGISPAWCNCSAGFTKYPFDVLFDKDLDVTCIATPLQGDEICRFKISLAGVDYKR
jgi:hypothetical protein